MQGFTPLAALVIAGLVIAPLALGMGCATSVDVVFDEDRDFSPYRTWEWLPGHARRVEAPRGDPAVLDKALKRLVHENLSDRGLGRSGPEDEPDLLVSAYLGIQRQHVWVTQSGAMQTLHSMHDSPSYEIESTRQELHTYEKGYLVIAITDTRQRRMVWRGEYTGRFRESFWPHMEDAVSTLLAGFPPR